MRIGRNLTVQEVYNIVNEYNSTYELTETQINNIIANEEGAIGCLSQLVGIDSNKVPLTILTASNQEVSSGVWADVIWTHVRIDNLGMFDPAHPTLLSPPSSGLYLITAGGYFEPNANGYRRIDFNGDFIKYLTMVKQAGLGGTDAMTISGEILAKYTGSFRMSFLQNSGSTLTLSSQFIVIHRKSITSYIEF